MVLVEVPLQQTGRLELRQVFGPTSSPLKSWSVFRKYPQTKSKIGGKHTILLKLVCHYDPGCWWVDVLMEFAWAKGVGSKVDGLMAPRAITCVFVYNKFLTV
jgi:hypothetical protein